MRTYTMVVDGVPRIAFRAESDADATRQVVSFAAFAKDELGAEGKIWTSRLATIPEQAKWRAGSVEATEYSCANYDEDYDVDYFDDIGLLVPLDGG